MIWAIFYPESAWGQLKQPNFYPEKLLRDFAKLKKILSGQCYVVWDFKKIRQFLSGFGNGI